MDCIIYWAHLNPQQSSAHQYVLFLNSQLGIWENYSLLNTMHSFFHFKTGAAMNFWSSISLTVQFADRPLESTVEHLPVSRGLIRQFVPLTSRYRPSTSSDARRARSRTHTYTAGSGLYKRACDSCVDSEKWECVCIWICWFMIL